MDLSTFKKRFLKNGFVRWTAYVLLALTVFLIALGYFTDRSGRKFAVNLMDHWDDKGAYAYLEVASFDEWVCKYDDETYYVIFDTENGAYLSVISDRQMRKMERKASSVENFTHYFDEPYVVYGLVKSTSYQLISYVEDVYGLEPDQFHQYFGDCYINTTENPKTNTAWMWWTFSIFSGLFGLLFAVLWLGNDIPFNKESRGLTEYERAEAVRLLDENDKKQNIIFGDDLLISRKRAMAVRYSDIIWIHLVDSYYNGIYTGQTLSIHTRSRNEFRLSPSDRKSTYELNSIMSGIQEKNPDVIVGFSRENRKQYDQLTKSRT
ncbi:MAG: hypothetical protein IKD87_06305 [Oscillospiraceae bacterium]|nr:hypothetical protein [Oscillospiraceae bacterium]